MYRYELLKNLPSLSVLIPAYNEEEIIKETILAIQNVEYPKELIEIIVVNDGSKDRTFEIVKEVKGIRILNKENSGKADSLNIALKIANGEIIVVNDADSFPEKDAFLKMVHYFKDKDVGAVTSTILVKNRNNLLEKLQSIEYKMIAYGRKLFEYIDSVFVTPGALSMYRKEALLKVGGFDKKNLTEDIEIAWNLLSKLFKIKMCLNARTYTVVPSKFRKWWSQRLRWDIGGFQTLHKYKGYLFSKKHSTLGTFVIPFFGSYILLSFIGIFVFLFLLTRRLIVEFFSVYSSILNDAELFRIDVLNFSPSVFTFFGILLFIIFLSYTIVGIKFMDREKISFKDKINIFIYLMFYVVLTPILLMHSFYRIIIGKLQW